MPHSASSSRSTTVSRRAIMAEQARAAARRLEAKATPDRSRLMAPHWRVIKRSIDIAMSALALLVLLPFLVLAALAIVLRDPGPWWYGQWREGRHGRPFTMWKLRTMCVDADARLHAHLAEDPHARHEWESTFKLSRDPRLVSGIGATLRRWSLDECPQFWNVLRGQMSLVGPRALPDYHLQAFKPEFRTFRQQVRPGMTGLWQVMSRGEGAVHTQESFDTYYITHWSPWLDTVILARTVRAVLSGRGAR